MGTAIQRADVHFMIDTSVSMQGYIDNVRSSLADTIIPGVTAAIPDVWFGAGQFDVCPSSGWHFCERWGGCSCGGDTCEDCLTFPESSAIISGFSAMHGRLVVLGPTGNSPEWAPIVTATGAVDELAAPLIFRDAGTDSIDRAVVDAIARLARSTPLSVTARVADLDDDGVDASAFVERIEPNVTGGVADPRDASRVCVGGLTTADADGDGLADGFEEVPAGTDVCFDIVARRNETVPPAAEPQIFRARIEVIGDGVTVLDERTIYFLVPSADAPPILI